MSTGSVREAVSASPPNCCDTCASLSVPAANAATVGAAFPTCSWLHAQNEVTNFSCRKYANDGFLQALNEPSWMIVRCADTVNVYEQKAVQQSEILESILRTTWITCSKYRVTELRKQTSCCLKTSMHFKPCVTVLHSQAAGCCLISFQDYPEASQQDPLSRTRPECVADCRLRFRREPR